MPDLTPIYLADGSLYAWATDQRLATLQSAGLVSRVVRRRNGAVTRAILHLRPGDPQPSLPNSVLGVRYAVREHLSHGPAWDLRHLGGSQDGSSYAPPESREPFLRVLRDCTIEGSTSADHPTAPSA